VNPLKRLLSLFLLSSCWLVASLVVAPAAQQADRLDVPSEEEQSLFIKGQSLHNQGLYNEAVNVLNQFLESYPQSVIKDLGLLWLGRSYLAQGDLASAERVELRLRALSESALLGIYEEELRIARQNYARAATLSPSLRPAISKTKPRSETRTGSENPMRRTTGSDAIATRPVVISVPTEISIVHLHADKVHLAEQSITLLSAPKISKFMEPSTVVEKKTDVLKTQAPVEVPLLRLKTEEMPISAASNISYRLIIVNEGTGTAKDLTIRVELDAALDFTGSTPLANRQELFAQRQVLTFRLPMLRAGESQDIQISIHSRHSAVVDLATQTKQTVFYRDSRGDPFHTP